MVAFLSANPKTITKLFSNHQPELRILLQRSHSFEGRLRLVVHQAIDFPSQCTTVEILFRLYLIAQTTTCQPLIDLLLSDTQLNVGQ